MKNELRIIGGRWRSRKIRFPDVPGLRPTPDRLRETLFNWLGQDLEGLSCLDLFAGSGALGLEAASRGAGRVVLVDNGAEACRALRHNCALLEAGAAVEVAEAEAARFLRGAGRPFDVVFIDPPFRQNLAAPACRLLEANGWLSPGARVYVETERGLPLGAPANWQILREKQMGEVACRLCRRQPPGGGVQ